MPSPRPAPATTLPPEASLVRYAPSLEQVEADEPETFRALTDTLLEISATTHADTGRALRSVHAKSHGILRGQLQVLPVDAPWAQGLFATPGVHDAILRLSTSPGDELDDHVSTPRGIALKVLGVEGERLPGPEHATQDFLFVDGPVFLAPGPKQFLKSLKLLAATTDRVPSLKRAFSALARGAEHVLEAVGTSSATLSGLGGHAIDHPLGATVYTQVPFRHGTYVAKYALVPVSRDLALLEGAAVDLDGDPDGLRAAVSDHVREHGGTWELRAQLCTSVEDMPIEDASVEWPQDRSPFVTVARLTVPPQATPEGDALREQDEGLSFSPWHGLVAHQPLGGVNRARRPAYEASANARSGRARCPVHEPVRAARGPGAAASATPMPPAMTASPAGGDTSLPVGSQLGLLD